MPFSKWLVLSIFVFSANWTAIQSYLHGLNAAQLGNRSVIYEQTQRTVVHGLHKSELYNFQLNTQSNFSSSTHPSAAALRNASISQIHDYDPFKFCSDAFDELVSVNVEGSSSRKRFDAQAFLSAVSHKRIAFVGDSLMRQFYLEFASEMLPLETNHRYGYAEGDAAISKVSRVHVASATLQTSYTENRYSTREYAKSNLTVMWCHDDNLQGLTITKTTTTNADNNPAHHYLPCLQEAVHNDVIILGVGLWYKPLHPPTTQTDYYQDMELKYNKLVMSLMRYRGLIHRANPRAHVLWQLIPHIGQLDEDLAVKKIYASTLESTHPEWLTGKYWYEERCGLCTTTTLFMLLQRDFRIKFLTVIDCRICISSTSKPETLRFTVTSLIIVPDLFLEGRCFCFKMLFLMGKFGLTATMHSRIKHHIRDHQ